MPYRTPYVLCLLVAVAGALIAAVYREILLGGFVVLLGSVGAYICARNIDGESTTR